jgi:lipoate-protein ligase B
MIVLDLATMPYRQAWDLQEQAHSAVSAGEEERLLLVEHPPVITFGRRPNLQRNLITPPDQLARLNVEVVQSDRGGDITFHGPGQIVAYPIVRLIDHQLSIGGYVRRLEEAVISTLADFNIPAQKDPSAIGVWVAHNDQLRKICALGVRIRRGVSMHGIALNVTTDLCFFNLIVPCGLAGRGVTSMQQLLGDTTPTMPQVKATLQRHITQAFSHGDK